MKFLFKDVTTIDEGIIAHGVNCQRVMGSGVAWAIRSKWPTVFYQYENHTPVLGSTQFVEITPVLFVANCYTQDTFGRDNKPYANLDAIRTSLGEVFNFASAMGFPLYMPRIGCGLGGLKWDNVRPIIEELEQQYQGVEVTICDI